MCGIVGYAGESRAQPIMLEGLKRLEYRGYDSAGLAVVEDGALRRRRTVGRVGVLDEALASESPWTGGLGVAHTRWATHGGPSEANAHPHLGVTADGHTVAVVHNGIVENHEALRRHLIGRGRTFSSETDTEALAQMIAELDDGDLEKAVQAALREVVGAYAIAVVCDREPDHLVCARKGSPLLIGLAPRGYLAASDPAAIVSHTSQVVALDDGQVACLEGSRAGEGDGMRTRTLHDRPVTPAVSELEMSLEQIELDGYAHFMEKEIMEQPEALRGALRGRIEDDPPRVVLGGLASVRREMARTRRYLLIGQGTAYHAAKIGAYLLEDLAKVPAQAEYASEFRYRSPLVEADTAAIAVTQSGETADTRAALAEAMERGALGLGVVNAVGSTITRETDAGVYLHVGPEIGVASTKAFLGQALVLTLLALHVGRRRLLSEEALAAHVRELDRLPDHVSRVLESSDAIRSATERFIERPNWLFLGRGYNYPVAMEGALKFKEISYRHAEGMPAAEMKHGPLALIEPGMPVVFVVPQGGQYEKAIANIQEVRARGGRILAVATEGDRRIEELADAVFPVPALPESLQPLVSVVPLQLLAYHAAVMRGLDVDKPRNLAKSVTVE